MSFEGHVDVSSVTNEGWYFSLECFEIPKCERSVHMWLLPILGQILNVQMCALALFIMLCRLSAFQGRGILYCSVAAFDKYNTGPLGLLGMVLALSSFSKREIWGAEFCIGHTDVALVSVTLDYASSTAATSFQCHLASPARGSPIVLGF